MTEKPDGEQRKDRARGPRQPSERRQIESFVARANEQYRGYTIVVRCSGQGDESFKLYGPKDMHISGMIGLLSGAIEVFEEEIEEEDDAD